MSSEEARQLRQLEEQVRLANDQLFKRRRDLQRLHADMEEDGRRLQQVREQASAVQDHIGQLQSAEQHVGAEVGEEEQKCARAERALQQKRARYRAERGLREEEETVEERAMEVASVQENSRNVLFTLAELAREFPEIQVRW